MLGPVTEDNNRYRDIFRVAYWAASPLVGCQRSLKFQQCDDAVFFGGDFKTETTLPLPEYLQAVSEKRPL